MNWFHPPQVRALTTSYLKPGYILTDEVSFYYRFSEDLKSADKEVIIETPFITVLRIKKLKNLFETLVYRGVGVFVITRHPEEHSQFMAQQAELGIRFFEQLGIQVLMYRDHHRKMALIDRRIIWKGSLNILSHHHSHEFMEREEDQVKSKAMFSFLKYDHIKEINNHMLN